MSSGLETIDQAAIGERLKIARENAGLKQSDVAMRLNIARTTLVAIEQGQRRVRIRELQNLAAVYGVSANSILRPESVHVELTPRFRKLLDDREDAASIASKALSDLATAEVELENILGVRRARNYPAERPILPGNVATQAEQDAGEVRQWLGLGHAPVNDIFSLLEFDMGVRLYFRRLPGKISGLFAYEDQIGACVLLNSNELKERRVLTAAHELGHIISTRRQPEILDDHTQENSREERYANTFARAFLMPPRGVMQKFNEITMGSETLTRRAVILLAHHFGVSREALVRRLEELSLAKKGTWDFFQDNNGITDDQARQVLGDRKPRDISYAEKNAVIPLRLSALAAESHRRGLLTEGQLSSLLKIDRLAVREIFLEEELMADEAESSDR